MDTFDLDLEDLDLKSVDIKPTTPVTTSNDYRNISFNGGSSQSGLNMSSSNISKPNLTISNSNNDPMPSGFNSDKEVDFGLDLLMNKKKIRPETEVNKLGGSSMATSPTPKTFNFTSNSSNGANGANGLFGGGSMGNGSSSGFPERIDLNNETDILQKSLFDNVTDIDLDKELSTMDLGDIAKPNPVMSGPSLPSFSSTSANTTTPSAFQNASASSTSGFPSASSASTYGGYGSINTGGISSNAGLSFEEIQTKKFDLLCKFERLRDKGVKLPKTFSMSSSLDEMELEYKRLVEHRQLDNSVKMQRRMLISFASGLEFLNGKFSNPFDLNIDGWSEHLTEEIDDFSDIFEDLYYKYKDSVNMAPELKLAMMVGSSAFWYHLTSNMSKSMMPNLMNNVMKQNPDLMRQFQNATLNTMSQSNPNFAQFMGGNTPGMNMNGGNAPGMNMNGGNAPGMNQGPPKYNPMNAPPFANPRDAPPRGQTNINQTDDIDALIDSIL
jgi:hypothetical protein